MIKIMKRMNAFLFICLYISYTSSAQTITTPNAASPAASVSQTIGIATVTVKYSRPSVKGREIWGKLVPYGWNAQAFGSRKDAPWRAGANENTVIEFTHPAMVLGKPVPAGAYGLFFVINKDNSGEVILSKDFRSWGSFWYNPAQDQLRAPITIRDTSPVELLTYSFVNLGKNSAELVLSWERKEFPVAITFTVDEQVIANAKEELKGPAGFSWQGYRSAANYALVNNVEGELGLQWIDQAIAQNKSFTTLIIKSGLLKQTGKTEESEKVRKEAIVVANEAELNSYGYQLLGQSNYDQAIEVLKLATDRYPKSANAWDSLGEGYAIKGDQKNAIVCFKKSMSMNPPENVKLNSEKYLKQFGAL